MSTVYERVVVAGDIELIVALIAHKFFPGQQAINQSAKVMCSAAASLEVGKVRSHSSKTHYVCKSWTVQTSMLLHGMRDSKRSTCDRTRNRANEKSL